MLAPGGPHEQWPSDTTIPSLAMSAPLLTSVTRNRVGGPPSRGQTHTVGTITCDSQDFGVTCTDAGTGHYIRASTGSYDLG